MDSSQDCIAPRIWQNPVYSRESDKPLHIQYLCGMQWFRALAGCHADVMGIFLPLSLGAETRIWPDVGYRTPM